MIRALRYHAHRLLWRGTIDTIRWIVTGTQYPHCWGTRGRRVFLGDREVTDVLRVNVRKGWAIRLKDGRPQLNEAGDDILTERIEGDLRLVKPERAKRVVLPPTFEFDYSEKQHRIARGEKA